MNSLRIKRNGVVINKSIIKKIKNNLKVDMPRFLYKINVRFAFVSLIKYHKKRVRKSFTAMTRKIIFPQKGNKTRLITIE